MTIAQKLGRNTAARHLYDELGEKALELCTIRGFLYRLQIDPLSIKESERPDFLLSFPNIGVGLELTVLSADALPGRGSAERQLHSKWRKLARCLREKLVREADPIPHTYGSVFFRKNGWQLLDGKRRNTFCDEVIDVLKKVALSTSGFEISGFDGLRAPLLADLVEHLYVSVFPQEAGFMWWCADLQSGAVVPVRDAIRRIVANKITRAKTYAWGNGSEHWLLVYAPGNGLVDLAVNLEDPRIESAQPFDYVFVWDKFSETITSLFPHFEILLENACTFYPRRLPRSVISG